MPGALVLQNTVEKTLFTGPFLVVSLLFLEIFESALVYITGSVRWPSKVKALIGRQMTDLKFSPWRTDMMERTSSLKLSSGFHTQVH